MGRCILAQYDDQIVIIYQAYRPAITKFAVYDSDFDCGELIYTTKESLLCV
ncbi:DUF4291 family protein [Nostoc sp. LPT]|uniref:DUF4291 family protein n=1 Tax=Nostoc sp. LPT TaxID=2815387 RepID=UPI001D208980|nr:DUF4291 family protein [Nostoc sp. LPT]